jgi:acyl-CoA thioester hydrolase
VNDVSPLLADFRVITTIPVLWSDEDAFGHVNNVVFLRWCEEGRVQYLHRIPLWSDAPSSGVGPIIASVHCDYREQVRYPDTVDIGTKVERIGTSSIRLRQTLVSRNDNVVVAEAHATLVLFDYTQQRPVRVPDDLRQRIADLEEAPLATIAPAASGAA